jgi:hypothetical protein
MIENSPEQEPYDEFYIIAEINGIKSIGIKRERQSSSGLSSLSEKISRLANS